MATIAVQVQSMLNTAVYDTYVTSDAVTVQTLKNYIQANTSVSSNWYQLYYLNEQLVNANTLSSYGIGNVQIRSANRIGNLATRELRQRAKLDLAALDRAESSEPRATYDLTLLPTQFDSNAVVNNPNAGGLVAGRPWIETVSAFTFYEAFGTTSAISTTQYVSGNKIYAESSTYDVPSFQPARVVVNDIEVVNTELRGHTLVVLDSNGNVVTAATQYDTWDTGGAPGARAALASALGAVASGNIVVLVSYDASGLDAGIRSAINTGYGSTNTDTWESQRRSHIFIGVKI
jgi:hypothetical protein